MPRPVGLVAAAALAALLFSFPSTGALADDAAEVTSYAEATITVGGMT